MGKLKFRIWYSLFPVLLLFLCFQNCSKGFGPGGSFASISQTLSRGFKNATGGVTRIMPLGDSITFGYSSADPSAAQGGYRVALFAGLPGNVQSVGSQNSGPSNFSQRANEGHSGYTIAQISQGISGWLSANPSNIILLHLGTNDFVQNIAAGAPDRLSSLMDSILAQSPGSTLIVASIIDLGIPWFDNSTVHAYNAQIQTIVAQKAAAGAQILFVDMNGAISVAAGSGDYDKDGIHPSAQGYQKMGNRWAGAVRQVLGTESLAGTFDGAAANGILGWACLVGTSQNIKVNAYSSGPSGVGTLIASGTANVASEPEVNSACQSDGQFRFHIQWPRGFRAAHQGETIFVYGVLPEGGFEVPISGSGILTVPAPPPANTASNAASSDAPTPETSTASDATPTDTAPPAVPIAVVAPAPTPTAIPSAPPTTSAPSGTTQAVPVPLSEATIFRFVDAGGAHVYSKNGDPNSQANYTLEGPAFQVYTQNYPGTVALNRCTQGNLHFLSAEPTCEASTVAGVLGYISSNQVGGTVPLYRFNNANWVHTLESLNLGEGAGYTTTTTLGFVPAQ